MNCPGYQAIAELVVTRSGLSFPAGRQDGAERGIRRAMERAGVRDASQYRGLLDRDQKAFDDLMVELTVGETYFFREPAQFEFIRRQVLPEIRHRQGDDHDIRVWSAACASGEEAYSLAVLLEESGQAGRAHVLATDISRAALAKAARAEYTTWSLRGDGAKAVRPYLRRGGDGWVIDEKIRRYVRFEHLNLALDVYPSFATGTWGMDLILCRNALIYFDRETIGKVAQRLFASLAPGGWLITASSDPPLGTEAPFEAVVTDLGVFYRRPEREQSAVSNGHGAVGSEQRSAASEVGMAECVQSSQTHPSEIRDRCVCEDLTHPTRVPAADCKDPLDEARSALSRGDYARAVDVTRSHLDNLAASVIHVRALANRETTQAERACAEATVRHPLSPELHYLHAVLLMDLGRKEEAARAARRVIYLDRSLALAHFTLGSMLRRRGDRRGARRAYRNARELCAAMPPDQAVALGEGEQAGRLAEAAAAELAVLERGTADEAGEGAGGELTIIY
jgi:chemotaxis protein methyltransferase CheR